MPNITGAAVYRLKWMADAPDEYLACNEVYPGVDTALLFCEYPYYIASSKKAARVSALATQLLKLKGFESSDSPRLFASLLPPNEAKAETLRCAATTVPLPFIVYRCFFYHVLCL